MKNLLKKLNIDTESEFDEAIASDHDNLHDHVKEIAMWHEVSIYPAKAEEFLKYTSAIEISEAKFNLEFDEMSTDNGSIAAEIIATRLTLELKSQIGGVIDELEEICEKITTAREIIEEIVYTSEETEALGTLESEIEEAIATLNSL